MRRAQADRGADAVPALLARGGMQCGEQAPGAQAFSRSPWRAGSAWTRGATAPLPVPRTTWPVGAPIAGLPGLWGLPVLECPVPASMPQRGGLPVGDVPRVNPGGKGSAHGPCDTASAPVLRLVYCGHDLLYGPGVHGSPQRLRGLCPPHECRIWLEPGHDLARDSSSWPASWSPVWGPCSWP